MLLSLLLTFTIILDNAQCGFLSWLGWRDKSAHNLTYNGVPLVNVPYEELSPEDKFIVEASKIAGLDLSELDVCQQRVLLHLEGSCGGMNEEQLSRFSIALLNCHAESEGRPSIQCSDDMTLKECTAGMDNASWEAYHAVANRARAVCYAARQKHFRAASNIAVNALLRAAGDTVTLLQDAKVEKEHIRSSTKVAITEIDNLLHKISFKYRSAAAISKVLVDRMEMLKNNSLEHVDLMQAGTDKFANLVRRLASTFETLDKEIESSRKEVADSHASLLEDIKQISEKLNMLSSDMSELVAVSEMALNQSKELNSSLNFTLALARAWVSAAPGTDVDLVIHILWLAVSLLVVHSIGSPLWTRVVLLSVALGNYSFFYTEGKFVPLPTLYSGAFTAFLVIWIGALAQRFYIKKRKRSDGRQMNYSENIANGHVLSPREHMLETESVSSDLSSRYSVSRIDGVPRCIAMCATGRRCRKSAFRNSSFCYQHNSQ